jgi:hypothetical protein
MALSYANAAGAKCPVGSARRACPAHLRVIHPAGSFHAEAAGLGLGETVKLTDSATYAKVTRALGGRLLYNAVHADRLTFPGCPDP